jgi:hypothetical protein
VARRFKEIQTETGIDPRRPGLSHLTNEELYLFQKFCRGVLGTNHIDHAGGYSYAAHLALRDSLGYAASTNSINEIRKADVILALRSDLSETHPVIKSEVVLAVKRRKAKLIIVNSRDIYLKKFSSLSLRVKPGSEVTLVNALMAVILKEGLAQEEFIQSRTEGLKALKTALGSISPQKVEAQTGVPAENLAEAARLFAKATNGVILISAGQNSGKEDPALAQPLPTWPCSPGKSGRRAANLRAGERTMPRRAGYGRGPGLLPAMPIGDAPRGPLRESLNLTLPDQEGMGALAILQGSKRKDQGSTWPVKTPQLPTRTRRARKCPGLWISWSSRTVS